MARKTVKGGKFRNLHCRTWNMARKLKNMGNEKQTLFDLEYGEKHGKTCKMRNTHCRTCKMARNSENHEKVEMQTVGHGIYKKTEKR